MVLELICLFEWMDFIGRKVGLPIFGTLLCVQRGLSIKVQINLTYPGPFPNPDHVWKQKKILASLASSEYWHHNINCALIPLIVQNLIALDVGLSQEIPALHPPEINACLNLRHSAYIL